METQMMKLSDAGRLEARLSSVAPDWATNNSGNADIDSFLLSTITINDFYPDTSVAAAPSATSTSPIAATTGRQHSDFDFMTTASTAATSTIPELSMNAGGGGGAGSDSVGTGPSHLISRYCSLSTENLSNGACGSILACSSATCSETQDGGLTTLAAAATASIPAETAICGSGRENAATAAVNSSFPSVLDSIDPDVFAPLIKSSQLDSSGTAYFTNGASGASEGLPFQCDVSPFQTLSISQLAAWCDSPYPPSSSTSTAGFSSLATGPPQLPPVATDEKRGSSLLRKRRSSMASASGSSGRESQPKFRKTENQLAVLVKYFSINRLPDRDAVEKLAEVTGLTVSEVKNWFRNRRLRYKDVKETTKRKQATYNGTLTPSQHALLESVSEAAQALSSNPYGKHHHHQQQQQKKLVSSKPTAPLSQLSYAEGEEQLQNSDVSRDCAAVDGNKSSSAVIGPPARRSERLRSKQEARSSFESALYKWASNENGATTVSPSLREENTSVSTAAMKSAGAGASAVPSSSSLGLSTNYDAFFEDSSFPSIVVTPSESKDDCLFGGGHDVSSTAPSTSYLSSRHSTASELTPPTTPSLAFFPPPLPPPPHATDYPAIFSNESQLNSSGDDVSQDLFGEVKDFLQDLFVSYAPNSSDRLELLKTLLKDLNVKERTAVQQLVNIPSDDRYVKCPQMLAKEAWKELEERFGVIQTLRTATNEAVYGRQESSRGMDTPPRSDHSDVDSLNEGSSALLDQNMVEGLKCMFQPHRDYLYAVAKRLGVGTAGCTVKQEQSNNV